MKNNLKSFTISAIVASSLGVMAVSLPNSFTAGQPIKAADVNANFSSLKTAVDTLEALPQITVPFLLTGTGSGIANATIRTSNTNGGIAAVFGQTKTGASDAALVIGQSGDGPLIKGFGSNGGEDEFRVDSNGTLTLFKPNFTPNIVLNNTTGGGAFSGTVTATSALGFGVHGITNDPNAYGGYFESTTGPGLRIKSGGNGNILTSFGADNGIKFQVDKDGNGAFSGNVTANGVLLTSDRNLKKNFSSVNSLSILEKVARLPISSWNYKTDANSLRHIGPMAQDFHATFGLNGTDNKHISSIDEQGVALAAIQGLNLKLEQRNAKIKQLESQLASFEARLATLERK